MRPLKLTLTGFHGIRDGMRRDSVTLDLSDLPTGLIALTGPNGAGKTTLMDNLHPYPIMPSHASKMSPDAFSYWDHLCATRAEKDLEWAHTGKTYRSQFAFRNPGKSRKAEYYLFEREGTDDWKAVVLPDGTASDGKAETYNRCIESILGSCEAFFTSVFSAQNRRPIASYQASEIKKLLADLLGIDYLRDLSAKAGEVAKVLSRALDVRQRDLVVLGGRRDQLLSLETQLAKAVGDLVSQRGVRETEVANSAKLMQERATLAAKQSATAAADVRSRELRGRVAELTTKRRQIDVDRHSADSKAALRKRDLLKTIEARRATLSERDAILAAAAKRDEIQLAIGRKSDEVTGLQKGADSLKAIQAASNVLGAELSGLQQRGQSAAALAKSLKAQADVIVTVPCSGQSMQGRCPLLAQAGEAQGKLPEQVISVEALRKAYQEKLQAQKPMAVSLAELPQRQAALTAAQADLARLQAELRRFADLAAKRPILDAAHEGLVQAEADLKALENDARATSERHARDLDEVAAQLAVVERELAGLATEDLAGTITALDRRITTSREAVVGLDARIEDLIRLHTMLETEQGRLRTELAALPVAQASAERLSDEIAVWKLLAKGLGNDGVIALSIDDAGPALTGIVNDLLLACYGPRFTIAIQTQTALTNGEKREGFEIVVIDADSGTEKNFAFMSGGQKIWINECLTRGIALYRAQDSGQSFHTLFTDEADGPLDPERKRAFMRMKREVLRVGGYAREFFISHTPDLVDNADAVVDVLALALR